MQDAVRGEIFPVVGIEGVEQPCGKNAGEMRDPSGHRHGQGEGELGDRAIEQRRMI